LFFSLLHTIHHTQLGEKLSHIEEENNTMNEKQLLKGLSSQLAGKGIRLDVRSLARYTAESGVMVTVSCGRASGSISLPPRLLGLCPDKWDKESLAFYADHVSLGKVTLIPKDYEKDLNRLDTQARRLIGEYATTGDGTRARYSSYGATAAGYYVPLAVYQEFKEKFEDIRSEYFAAIDKVVQDWDILLANFTASLTETVNKRCRNTMLKRDREKLINDVLSAIPNKEQYKNRAHMDLTVRMFPTTGAPTVGLAPDLQDTVNQTWRQDVVSNAIRSIEASLGEVFAQACSIADTYGKMGKVNARSLNTLVRISIRVRRMNIFANPMLEQLAKRLDGLAGKPDDEVEDLVEESIVDAYEYAKATGLGLDLDNCPFSKSDLDKMVARRKAVSATETNEQGA